ncbi:hypothetical protein [Nocardia sp. SSK8]|uniref:hypothetical protein n=1 Tax=Nocardia sp. SSK8 TaxID=3120154 RepID=UPI00300A0587
MRRQGDVAASGGAAMTAAILSAVIAGVCAVVALLVAAVVGSLEDAIGDDSGASIVVAVALEVPILIWFGGSVAMLFRRRVGRWIVAVFAGIGTFGAVSVAVGGASGARLWAVLATVVFGVIFALTVSRSTGRWMR